MREFVAQNIKPGQIFGREEAVGWFAKNYPKIKPMTVRMHVNGMSVNSRQRKHHPSIKPGSGHDLFYKLGPDQFRLWDETTDEAPFYAGMSEPEVVTDAVDEAEFSAAENAIGELGAKEFALETDLRNYISRNLPVIEPGLRLYEDEGLTGIEFPADGRRIDILCVDKNENFVVIELKVSRGYDRVIGQLLRYMAWVKTNLAEGKSVRGIIVASEIGSDLRLAASMVSNVLLVEYAISFQLKHVL